MPPWPNSPRQTGITTFAARLRHQGVNAARRWILPPPSLTPMTLVPRSPVGSAPMAQGSGVPSIGDRVATVDTQLTASTQAEQSFVLVYDSLFPRLCAF